MGDGSLSNVSFRRFVFFSKLLGLPVGGFEKALTSLLRKLEARKGRRVGASSIKRRYPLCLALIGSFRS